MIPSVSVTAQVRWFQDVVNEALRPYLGGTRGAEFRPSGRSQCAPEVDGCGLLAVRVAIVIVGVGTERRSRNSEVRFYNDSASARTG